VLPVRGVAVPAVSTRYHLDLTNVVGGEIRRASDGWHAIVPLGGANHRLWMQELPPGGSTLAVELSLDADFDLRARAANRLRNAIEQAPLGPVLLPLTFQRRQRLTLAIRATDGRLEGNTYREIAGGLFGWQRTLGRDWRTHDLRNRTIRLVQSGFALMSGGYRALLRPLSRKK
jgi:hypothetical protein